MRQWLPAPFLSSPPGVDPSGSTRCGAASSLLHRARGAAEGRLAFSAGPTRWDLLSWDFVPRLSGHVKVISWALLAWETWFRFVFG